VSEQLLTVLKFCLLVLIYLFLFRVLRAVWAEISPPKAPARAKAPKPVKAARATKPTKADRAAPRVPLLPSQLTVVDPPEQRGRVYPLGPEISVGRGSGCQVMVEDTFASTVHARVFLGDGNYVVEDLGSTNGTYLNKRKVDGPMTMNRGDRLQVGNTVLELE
jgi:pSer/pThr/pTyr-binding forkhead associated (FHA) protein